jgi:hypothetical protein
MPRDGFPKKSLDNSASVFSKEFDKCAPSYSIFPPFACRLQLSAPDPGADRLRMVTADLGYFAYRQLIEIAPVFIHASAFSAQPWGPMIRRQVRAVC